MPDTYSPTPWVLRSFVWKHGKPVFTVEDVAEFLAATARNSRGMRLFGVSCKDEAAGDEPVVCYTGNGPTSEANARFIVRAVNAHDELVAALRGLMDFMQDESGEMDAFTVCEVAANAIAKAEGKR